MTQINIQHYILFHHLFRFLSLYFINYSDHSSCIHKYSQHPLLSSSYFSTILLQFVQAYFLPHQYSLYQHQYCLSTHWLVFPHLHFWFCQLLFYVACNMFGHNTKIHTKFCKSVHPPDQRIHNYDDQQENDKDEKGYSSTKEKISYISIIYTQCLLSLCEFFRILMMLKYTNV